MKYGIFINDGRNEWCYPDCCSFLSGNIPSSIKGKDGRFETTDLNFAYRYLARQREYDKFGCYMEVRERTNQ